MRGGSPKLVGARRAFDRRTRRDPLACCGSRACVVRCASYHFCPPDGKQGDRHGLQVSDVPTSLRTADGKGNGRDHREIHPISGLPGGELSDPAGSAPQPAQTPAVSLPGRRSRPEVGDGKTNPRDGGLNRTKFLAFPEGSIPFRYKDEIVQLIDGRFPFNSVVILGFEHIPFRQYWQLLTEYRTFNEEAYELVLNQRAAEAEDRPVNWCMIVVKDDTGRLHCYLEAKTHPFFGEEFLDEPRDLYRGRHIYLFRSTFIPFNFIVLICLDYIYRDLH